jgi:hypothetical protein
MNGTTGGEGGLEHMALQIKENSCQIIHSNTNISIFHSPSLAGTVPGSIQTGEMDGSSSRFDR